MKNSPPCFCFEAFSPAAPVDGDEGESAVCQEGKAPGRVAE